MSGTTSLHREIENAFEGSSVDSSIKSYWTDDEKARFPTFIESEGTPGHPFPRVVYRVSAAINSIRMSSRGPGSKKECKEYPVVFEIYAKQTAGKTAKGVAAQITDELMKLFGGHAEFEPTATFNVQPGCVIDVRYVSDFGMRLEDTVYLQTLTYLFRLDTPIKVMK